MGRKLNEAHGQMNAARSNLSRGRVGEGARREGVALDKLEQAIKMADRAQRQLARNMQGRAAVMRPARGRQDGQLGQRVGDVAIPDAAAFKAPEEFRGEITRALRDGLPAAYRQWNEQYYEELVK